MKWAEQAARMGEMRNEYKISVGKLKGRELERPRRRLEDNIRLDLRKQGGKVWSAFIWFRTGTSGGSL
jgi:hypothetical protein